MAKKDPQKLRITPKGSAGAAAAADAGVAVAAAGALLAGNVSGLVSALGAASKVPRPVSVKFNPKDYVIEQSNLFAEIGIPGLEAPILQYVRGNTEKLTFDLLIDETDRKPGSSERNAMRQADAIQLLARVEAERHAPPICTFAWGHDVMEGVIESVRRQFLLFDPDGTPVRIQITLGVKRYRTLKEQIGTMNRQSPDRTKTYVVAQGDTLPAIAFRAYGDATLWRGIAAWKQNAARIADPTRLQPGLILEIPRVEGAS
jgi:nucleoid-associated protein YgaU